MKSKVKNSRGHRAGHWLTTSNPESTGFPSADILSGSGASEVGEAVLVVILFAAYAFFVWAYGVIVRRKRPSGKWDDYQGMVYCQIYNDDLRFFKTVRGTSRVVMKPPAIIRPLADLVEFQTYTTQSPKLSFTFSDGFSLEFYSNGDEDELAKFREVVNVLLTA